MTSKPEIVVTMAVFQPNADMLAAQVQSIAGQEAVTVRLVIVIADGSSAPMVTRLTKECGLSCELVEPDRATQSYESFELGLTRALTLFPNAACYALADQDDIWVPEKLALCNRRLVETGATLVHSDARVVDHDGQLLSSSLHRYERRLERPGIRDLLAENGVTGMTVCLPRATLEVALPFPKQAALFFHHDLWLALVASALGPIERIRKPLVDYRQHDRNVVGARIFKEEGSRLFGPAWRRHWGGTYYVAAYLAKALYMRMEEVTASGSSKIESQRLAALAPYLSVGGIGLQHLLDALGFLVRGRPDLARKSALFTGVRIARNALALRRALAEGFLPALVAFDRQAFSSAPGVLPSESATSTPIRHDAAPKQVSSDTFLDRRRTARFPISVALHRSPGVTILVPSLNPQEVFAGIATAIDVGLGLSARGHPVTFVASDLPIANEGAVRSFLQSRHIAIGATSAPSPLRLHCGVTGGNLEISSQETLLATAWWTAHLASDLIRAHGLPRDRFYYLVQDYEPGFYAWGDDHAGALESYALGAQPIFNSKPLAACFQSEGLFAQETEPLIFHPAIDTTLYARLVRPRGGPRCLAFYGRPEVARNLFGTGVTAIERFLHEAHPARAEIDIVSIGLHHDDVVFSTGHRMRSLGKIPWSDYPEFLARVDLGLSLMLSPHPSHPPIEMAAAGARVVTNTFHGKCLGNLTPAISSVEPRADHLAEAMKTAWHQGPVSDPDRQIDLTTLGEPLHDVVSKLSTRIQSQQTCLRMTA